MKNLQLMMIWLRFKRWIRSILVRIGTKKPINVKEELDELIDIANDTLDVQQEKTTPTASAGQDQSLTTDSPTPLPNHDSSRRRLLRRRNRPQ